MSPQSMPLSPAVLSPAVPSPAVLSTVAFGSDLVAGGDRPDLAAGGDRPDLSAGGDRPDLSAGGDRPDLLAGGEMVDLAPMICRQRLVVEGRCAVPVSDADIKDYLNELSSVCDMHALLDPVTHRSDRYGWAGWIHWENSGAHFYAWERPVLFFSVDIYTCKAFDPKEVVTFTTDFFAADPVVAKAF